MKQTKHITKLQFHQAQYQLADKKGRQLLLKIDYEHNTFMTEADAADHEQSFINEVSELARDLLRRKHGVNFAHSSD